MTGFINMDRIKLRTYVSFFIIIVLIVYATVRLRFPDDNLLKACIGFITDNIKDFNVK